MTNPVFPTLYSDSKATVVYGQDSKYYGIDLEDPSLKTSMEGGYVVSRAKHTRKPRRTYTTGFSNIEVWHKNTLDNFYDSVRGASVIFDWKDPTDPTGATVRQVRFSGKFNFKYVGAFGKHRWDVTFSLEEA